MKKLIDQILKFGVVGIISFIVDFVITMAVSTGLRQGRGHGDITGGVNRCLFGFVVSVIVNYILSMKYVFERRDDLDRKKNSSSLLCSVYSVWASTNLSFFSALILSMQTGHGFMHWLVLPLQQRGAKIVATAVVMVYNFVTRKIFLENKKTETEGE